MTLSAENLRVHFGAGSKRFAAVDGVDVRVPEGATLGLVGESGSGKSTLAKALVGLGDVEGEIKLDGAIVRTSEQRGLKALRSQVQLVFQDPSSSLNPRIPSGASVADGVIARGVAGRKDVSREVSRLFDMVRLPGSLAKRYPHELSGGQRQRVSLARALAVDPQVLIADEVTSALDVSVQAEVLNMLRRIQRDLGLSLLFISHDLSVVRYMSDVVSVMYLGKIVEEAPVQELFAQPKHPYTRSLLESVPTLRGAASSRPSWRPRGEVGDPKDRPCGCPFHPRCPVGPMVEANRQRCVDEVPLPVGDDRAFHRCHFPLNE